VRPHELRILHDNMVDTDALRACIARIIPSGAVVRIELLAEQSCTGPGQKPRFEAEVSRDWMTDVELKPGQSVRLMPTELHAFAPQTENGNRS